MEAFHAERWYLSDIYNFKTLNEETPILIQADV